MTKNSKLTRKDVIVYIMKIRLNFENAFTTHSDDEFDLLVESWLDALKEYPKEVCDIAVNNALKYAMFAPRLGNITEEIESILNADKKTDEELWAELTDILPKVYDISRYNSYPHYAAWAQHKLQEIFNSLDKSIRLFVVNTSTLTELSEMTEESLHFEKARFLKQLPSIRKRGEERERAQKLMGMIKPQNALPDGNNGKK